MRFQHKINTITLISCKRQIKIMDPMPIQIFGGSFHLFSQHKLKLIQFKIICNFHHMIGQKQKSMIVT